MITTNNADRTTRLLALMRKGDDALMPATWPTGKAFNQDFTTTARWEGDLLIEEYVFWDSALQAQQIGLCQSRASKTLSALV